MENCKNLRQELVGWNKAEVARAIGWTKNRFNYAVKLGLLAEPLGGCGKRAYYTAAQVAEIKALVSSL